jgi:hypothetical protein
MVTSAKELIELVEQNWHDNLQCDANEVAYLNGARPTGKFKQASVAVEDEWEVWVLPNGEEILIDLEGSGITAA